MIVLEKKPILDVRSESEAGLVVKRTDISFQDGAGGSVIVRVKIRNEGSRRTEPTIMRLESAPLGAFVPWRSLAALPVPSLEPGEWRELSVEASRPRPKALGSFDRVPPRNLLTAVNASPDGPAPQPRLAAIFTLFRQGTRRATEKGTTLAPDLSDLLGREQSHWAGNINVFIGTKAVERHLATALRIYSGRANMAMFLVGEPRRRDAYTFQIAGLAPDWQALLYDVTNAKTLVAGPSETAVRETQWVESAGQLMITLVVRPPMVCEDGNVEVHVTRRSCQKTAVVEFNLDPTAQGAGCYAV